MVPAIAYMHTGDCKLHYSIIYLLITILYYHSYLLPLYIDIVFYLPYLKCIYDYIEIQAMLNLAIPRVGKYLNTIVYL